MIIVGVLVEKKKHDRNCSYLEKFEAWKLYHGRVKNVVKNAETYFCYKENLQKEMSALMNINKMKLAEPLRRNFFFLLGEHRSVIKQSVYPLFL